MITPPKPADSHPTDSRRAERSASFCVAFRSVEAPFLVCMRAATNHHRRRLHPEADATAAVSLLDVGGAAARLSVTVRFVRRLVAERRIPYVKVGKFVRFDPADLEAWIDDHRVGQ